MRRVFADTFALVVFSTIAGLLVEVGISSLTVAQSARIRLAAIPLCMLTGRPYGAYRDYLFRLAAPTSEMFLGRFFLDVFANVSFQVPLYAALLMMNGASFGQTTEAAIGVCCISAICGRPYGAFLSLCRALLGVGSRRPIPSPEDH